ncbi:MAG: type I-MYXAN CRISPR-associated protein Cas6/Cmx6 [Sedimenticola sp.]
MYWQEDSNEEQFIVPEDVVDLAFKIDCPTLPVDHAWALSEAIRNELPWFGEETQTGLHIVHGADTGNGWERPTDADDLLYLSRRTPLMLRLPRHRSHDAHDLCGKTLDIDGHKMKVGDPKQRPLAMTDILYSRYMVCDPAWSEDDFMAWAVGELKGMRLKFKKILCGKGFELKHPDGPIQTRSLMIANLSYEDAVYLQEEGLGPHRQMGCGLFIPQKSF